jgi:anti-sigma factor RsiW
MMDSETLERLLMDRALGGLSPDVDSLLTTYLETDPQAAARAAEFQAAAITARMAFTQAAPSVLPPYPASQLEHLGQVRRRLVLIRNVAGLAAALVLGVGLGGAFFRHVGAQGGGAIEPAGPMLTRVFAVASATAESSGAEGMWSTQRLYERARSAKRADTARVFWDSPVEQPRFGGKS